MAQVGGRPDGESVPVDTLYRVDRLIKEYKARRVLDITDLVIRRNRLTVIVGKSGAGKSTLLNILAGLDRGSEVSRVLAAIGGEGLADLSKAQSKLSRKASYVFQQGHLLANGSLRLNLSLSANVVTTRDQQLSALEMAHLTEIGDAQDGDILDLRCRQLSGGEQQRLNVARAFIRDPEVIFADEPSSSLDKDTAGRVVNSLKEWLALRPGRSVIMVTHDRGLAMLADDLIVLDDGHVGYQGPCPSSIEDLNGLVPTSIARNELPLASDDQNVKFDAPEPGRFSLLRDALELAVQNLILPRLAVQGRRWRRFSRWPSTLIYFFLFALLCGAVTTKRISDNYFNEAVSDPRITQIVLGGNTMFEQETRLTPERIADLNDSGSGMFNIPNTGVYPRDDGIAEEIVVHNHSSEEPLSMIDERGRPRSRFSLSVLRLSSQEAVLDAMPLLDAQGVPTGRMIGPVMREADRRVGVIFIVLDIRYAEQLAANLATDMATVASGIRISRGGSRLKIELLGFYNEPVPDKGYVYQALMSLMSYREQLAATADAKLVNGDIRKYVRVAMYFDHTQFGATEKALKETHFDYSRDNFAKLARLISVSATLNAWMTFLVAGVAGGAAILFFVEAEGMMLHMRRSSLILIAQGVPSWVLAVTVWIQLALVSLTAAVVVSLGLFGTAVFVEQWELARSVLWVDLIWMLGVMLGLAWLLLRTSAKFKDRTSFGDDLRGE